MMMCIIIGQSQRDKGTGEPDEATSFTSGSEGGWGKRPAKDLARSLPSGCTFPATRRPWPSVVQSLASRRWRRQPRWTGRRCGRNGGTPIRSGVLPVGGGWGVGGSPGGGGPPPAYPRGSAPHEIRSTGEPDPGWRVPGDSQGTPPTAWRQSSRAVAAPRTAIAPAREGPARPVPDRMTEGGPTVISIARDGKSLVRP